MVKSYVSDRPSVIISGDLKIDKAKHQSVPTTHSPYRIIKKNRNIARLTLTYILLISLARVAYSN